MSERPVRPTVDRGEWIHIGPETAVLRRLGLVCSLDEERPRVVYLDDGDNAICERVVWDLDHWALVRPEVTATDADEDRLLAPYVKLLRSRLGRPGKTRKAAAKKKTATKAKPKAKAKVKAAAKMKMVVAKKKPAAKKKKGRR